MPEREKKTKNSWSPWSQSGGLKGRSTMEERICGKDELFMMYSKFRFSSSFFLGPHRANSSQRWVDQTTLNLGKDRMLVALSKFNYSSDALLCFETRTTERWYGQISHFLSLVKISRGWRNVRVSFSCKAVESLGGPPRVTPSMGWHPTKIYFLWLNLVVFF